MNIREDQKEMYRVAAEKGWHDEGLDKTFGECLMLMISEVSEALEEYRAGHNYNEIYYNPEKPQKPEGIPAELADYYIRLCDMCEQFGIDLQTDVDATTLVCVPVPKSSFTECLLFLCEETVDRWVESREEQNMGTCFLVLEHICNRFNIDLDTAVTVKHEYNKTRPYRHGNKKV